MSRKVTKWKGGKGKDRKEGLFGNDVYPQGSV